MKHPLWVRDYRNLDIHDSRMGHWGKGQTGFNLSESGRVFLSDGRKVKREGEWSYPCHRDLIDGEGQDRTVFSGIYSYGYAEGPTLWLYPFTEVALNDAMRQGLSSLIGVHRIAATTAVRSNNSRETLFLLREVCTVQALGTSQSLGM